MKKLLALTIILWLCVLLVFRLGRPVPSTIPGAGEPGTGAVARAMPSVDPAPPGSRPQGGAHPGAAAAVGGDGRAAGSSPTGYRETLLKRATVLKSRDGPGDGQGPSQRVRLVRAAYKYPLLRVETTRTRDVTSGAERDLRDLIMVADHILVKLRGGASLDDLHRLNATTGAVVRKTLHTQGWYLVGFPRATLDLVPEQVKAYGNAASVVACAEPDYIVFAAATLPNDPRFSELHGLHNTGQTGGTPDADVDAPEAWALTTGDGSVVVGVIDSGMDYLHEDLAANIWVNPGELPGNGQDDDKNGFIDDIHGWDFANDDADPFDDGEHGTHVAGTLAAVGDNGIGVAGMSWNTRVMVLKFLLGSGFGSTSDAVDAIHYATMMRRRGINIRLTNNSWGGGEFSQALEDAIVAGAAEDILFVAAAGNDALDTDLFPHYPSSYDHDSILSVANTTDRDELSELSNYGAVSVDLSAPGSEILSTTPGNTYSVFSGTSMATPLVSGVAAMMWTLDPELTYPEVRDAILDGADPVPALEDRMVTAGRLNAAQTLKQLGMLVISSIPADGSIVSAPPTQFEIRFSDAYDPATLQTDDLTVNGLAPVRALSVASNAVLFQFALSPSPSQGVHTMAMAEHAVSRLGDGDGMGAWNRTFRYDALPLEVISTRPAGDSLVTLPVHTLRLEFNEPVDPASVGTDDLFVNLGQVTSTSMAAPDAIEYTLSGVDREGRFTAHVLPGAVTDTHGNPCRSYTGGFDLDFGTLPAPAFQSLAPAGSLAYVTGASGSISSSLDTDRFTVELEPDQLFSVAAEPDENLRPVITVLDPNQDVLVEARAVRAGESVLAQGIPVTLAGTYTVELAGGHGSAGSYDLSIDLNIVHEEEAFGGGSNELAASAQDLDPAFTEVGPAARASVLGDPGVVGGGPPLITTEAEPNDDGVVGGSVADLQSANDWSGSFSRVDTDRYQASLAGEISAGEDADWDFFRILASPGDTLEVSLLGAPSGVGTLDDPYLRIYDRTGTEVASNDDFDTLESFISYDAFLYAGAYYVVADSFGDSTGTYRLEAAILSPHLIPGVGPGDDWYQFSMEADDSLSLVLFGLAGGAAPEMGLYTGNGDTLVAIGADLPDGGRAVLDYPASTTGTHYVRLSGARPYHLVVTRGAAFSIGNQTLPQALVYTGRALGAVGPGDAWFGVPSRVGNRLEVITHTPGDAPLQFDNELDPAVELYDPQGVLLAHADNNAPDGRNAVLVSTAPGAGIHRIRLSATKETTGEFLLEVWERSGDPPPLQVATTSPGSGDVLGFGVQDVTVNFSRLLRPASVHAADLLVDGAPATSVILEDGNSVRFEFPLLGHGSHTLVLAAGGVVDVAGIPNEMFSMVLEVDLIAPRVITSSVQENETRPVGDLLYTVGFSEALSGHLLDPGDLILTGDHAGTVGATEMAYDPTNLTLSVLFQNLPDDRYTLTLLSQAGAFQDPAGHVLDGEPVTWAIPPNASGDGTAGGDFVVHFDADTGTQDVPPIWRVRPPAGAMVHESMLTTRLSPSGDSDRFSLELEAGQYLSLIASPVTGARPSLTVYDPTHSVHGAHTASGPGLNAILRALPIDVSGSYTVDLSGTGTGTGPVDLALLLNTSLEHEAPKGTTNDDPGGAEYLDVGRMVVSTGGVVRTAVAGSSAGAPEVPPLVEELEPNDDGVAGGSAADLPFANDWSGSFTVTEANRSVASVTGSITAGDDADLDFYRLRAGPGDVLEVNLYGEPSGRGDLSDPYLRLFDNQGRELASNDDGGDGLESFLRYGEFTYRGTYFVVADSFGSSTGQYVLTAQHISPWQVNAESPGRDWYRFTMTTGEAVSLALGMSGPGILGLELFAEHATKLLAAGVPADNAEAMINGFVANEDGVYLARVTGTAPYTLVLTRGAQFEVEQNDAAAEAQAIDGTTPVLGHLQSTGPDEDFFTLDVRAGDVLAIETHTPGDAPGALDNLLDPTLELFDPTGAPVAFDDNSGTDGHNASLAHTATSEGWYLLKAASAEATHGSGEYVLELSGATGPGPGMRMVQSIPAQGDVLPTAPTHVTLTFSSAVNLPTLDPGDLAANGRPALSVTVIDGRTIAFELPSLPGGVYPVWMAEGAVTSLAGEPLEPTFLLFLVAGPRVIHSSLQNGDSLAPGPLETTVNFNRLMAGNHLDLSDLSLHGSRRGSILPLALEYRSPSSTSSVLHAAFPELKTDTYTLTLFSGDGQFEDEAGNDLDGDTRTSPTPLGISGNGVAGGHFSVTFLVAWPDADGDGLPDAWETRHHLDPNDNGSLHPDHGATGDPDGDGADNEHEQAAGTDPRDPDSLFAVSLITSGPNGISIQVPTQPGRRYTVKYSMGPTWKSFANPGNGIGTWMETNATPTHVTFVDDFTPETSGAPFTRRRYRVEVTPE